MNMKFGNYTSTEFHLGFYVINKLSIILSFQIQNFRIVERFGIKSSLILKTFLQRLSVLLLGMTTNITDKKTTKHCVVII